MAMECFMSRGWPRRTAEGSSPSVAGTRNDAGIRHLEGLTKFTELELRKTKADAASIEKLHKALPQCKIAWDGSVI